MSSVASSPVAIESQPPGAGVPARITLLFVLTSFLSAFLLFQVELIVSKYILPWFGGSAAVWSTSLLIFQLLLLGGYIYSHLLTAKLSSSAQSRLHVVVLACAAVLVITLQIAWPAAILPAASWKPEFSANPVFWVGKIIVVACGLPFFVLATTGPLLQKWYAQFGTGPKTYKLYSISNLGSLLGLLTFPFVFEPILRLKTQGLVWSVLFLGFAIGAAICALLTPESCEQEEDLSSDSAGSVRPTTPIYLLWFLLPACASALLLATTNLLCQEVTSVPLLWVLPLSIYLLTFILSFDHPRWYQRGVFHLGFALGVFVICGALIYEKGFVQLLNLPVLLFFACMICHGELVLIKPPVQKLTAFYLTIAAGGAAGGIFVALIAPQLFNFFTEFQLALGACVVLVLACVYLDSNSWFYASGFLQPLAIGVGAIAAAFIAAQSWPEVAALFRSINFYPIATLIVFLIVLGAYTLPGTVSASVRGFRFIQVLAVVLAILSLVVLIRSTKPLSGLFFSARNFYGAIRVFNVPRGKMLMHGRTIHGGQFEAPFDREPATYYGRQSGIGAVMMNHPRRQVGNGNLRAEMVGLGSGSLAAYGHPGDYFRYYEINPKVASLSEGTNPVFTYIRDSSARVEVLLGDARILMERETFSGDDQKYDVLVVDAFSGDAIPVHLLTSEAFGTYWQHLNPNDGVIAVHISSRHVNLLPVVLGAAGHFRAESLIYYQEGRGPFLSNCWVLLSRNAGVLASLGLQQNLPPGIESIKPRLWTDDYSDIVTLLKR